MAYNTNTPRAEYTASATQTVFPFLFKIFTTSDIKVYQTLAGATPDDVADILVLTTDYTVTINGDSGGEVTLNTGAAVNDKITLVRNLSVTRATEYQQNGDLLASTLNSDQEYQTYLIADNVSNDSRYIKVPDSVQNVSTDLPSPVGDSYFKWNAAGNAIENDTTIPAAVTTSAANAAAAAASATQAELYEWEAEAERLTADSYATEAEDTFVNLVTSDGDGTFTYTPTADYSALHWAAKAAIFNPALYVLDSDQEIDRRLWQNQAVTITPPTDADYTLTATENGYGRFILDTTAWTATHNIIVDNTERSFLVDNSSGTYTATVKTSAGTGIPVASGAKVWLLCDGTNVIGSINTLTLPTITGTATFTNTDQNINLVGVGALDGLEIGDVIQVADSTSNDTQYTVESITDSNNIVVNYEHRGQATSKALTDETSTSGVTVKLLSKWYNAPIGLGQGWCTPSSSRTAGVNETNSTGRTIKVSTSYRVDSSGSSLSIFQIDSRTESRAGGSSGGAIDTKSEYPITIDVPNGSVYTQSVVSPSFITLWEELR